MINSLSLIFIRFKKLIINLINLLEILLKKLLWVNTQSLKQRVKM